VKVSKLVYFASLSHLYNLKMKYIISFLGLGLVLLSAGCKNSSEDEETRVSPETKTVQAASDNTTAQPAQVSSGSDASLTTASVPQLNTVPATGALNPEHGKPGHRCDIAVGAPLDSKPAAAATVTPSTTTNTTVTPVNASKTVSAPAVSGSNLNPEHGKPGHRCDIAVGAPLDSKPAAVTTQPTVTSTPVNQQKAPLITPVLPTSTPAASTTVAPGMNPEHGKPGHRCDIAVGAPLNSAPKQ
jgi:hypothetical protein